MVVRIIKMTDKDFSVNEIIKDMKSSETGCIVTFVGIVRCVSPKGEVAKLEVEAYTEMAEKNLLELKEKAKKQFGIEDVSITHRIGRLKASENIVCIAVSAMHRKDAFKACEWLINEIKKIVPIWKKEIYRDDTNA